MKCSEYQTAKIIVGVFNVFSKDAAAIAGGCVRDRILGREPKDYDIFVNYTGVADIKELHILATRMGWGVENLSDASCQEDTSTRIKCILSLTKLGYQKIDVIFTNWSIQECIEAFPSSISQAWEIGDETYTTDAFKRTIETKTIVFTTGEECKHVQKVQHYFPDYKHIFKEK